MRDQHQLLNYKLNKMFFYSFASLIGIAIVYVAYNDRAITFVNEKYGIGFAGSKNIFYGINCNLIEFINFIGFAHQL